jgi:hypothetical protein
MMTHLVNHTDSGSEQEQTDEASWRSEKKAAWRRMTVTIAIATGQIQNMVAAPCQSQSQIPIPR